MRRSLPSALGRREGATCDGWEHRPRGVDETMAAHEKTVAEDIPRGCNARCGGRAPTGSAARIVVAVPVAAPATCDAFHDIADDIVCAVTPEPFRAVGLWYDDFSQTTDEEVHELLVKAGVPPGSRRPAGQT